MTGKHQREIKVLKLQDLSEKDSRWEDKRVVPSLKGRVPLHFSWGFPPAAFALRFQELMWWRPQVQGSGKVNATQQAQRQAAVTSSKSSYWFPMRGGIFQWCLGLGRAPPFQTIWRHWDTERWLLLLYTHISSCIDSRYWLSDRTHADRLQGLYQQATVSLGHRCWHLPFNTSL